MNSSRHGVRLSTQGQTLTVFISYNCACAMCFYVFSRVASCPVAHFLDFEHSLEQSPGFGTNSLSFQASASATPRSITTKDEIYRIPNFLTA